MRYLLILIVLAGCDILGPDVDYVNRRPMEPVPEVYALWYAAAEECLGTRGDFDAVRWWVADSVLADGRRRLGVFEPPDDITISLPWVETEVAVRHEMVHHIMGAGVATHDENGDVVCQR